MTDRDRERRKQRYQNMSSEEKATRREYQRIWMSRHRAELREQAKQSAAAKASNTVQAAPAEPSKVTRPKTRENAPQPMPTKPGKPKSVRAQHKAWRTDVATFFEDMLTDPRCPLSGQDYSTNRTYGLFFRIFDRLTQIENIADNEDQLAELRLSIAIEALRRLSGETPAGQAPVLPGIAQKPA